MNVPRPRALLVAWMFPPESSIGAKRPYKFARHLPASGWDVTVLCGGRPRADWTDPSPWPLPDGVRVERSYDAAWLTGLMNGFYEAASRLTARPATEASGAPALRRSRAARAFAAVEQLVWHTVPLEVVGVHAPHAIRTGVRLLRDARHDVIWTTSYPFSAHLVGLGLHRATGVPLVADLRDPWTLNFTFERKTVPAQWLERRLERAVFAAAARIVVTTETLAAEYARMYPEFARKLVAIRNSYDAIDLPPREIPRRPVRLVHFGHVYGGARTMTGVYEALARLRSRGAFAPGEVILENYGRLSDDDRARAEVLGVADLVAARDQLPYLEGLRRLRSSHLLLLPAWGTRRGRLFLPGKLYDYLLAGAPILALGENAELAGILGCTRTGTLLAEDDVDAIAAAIVAVLDGGAAYDPDPDAVAEFSAPRATSQLAALFEDVRREAGA